MTIEWEQSDSRDWIKDSALNFQIILWIWKIPEGDWRVLWIKCCDCNKQDEDTSQSTLVYKNDITSTHFFY